MRKSSIRSMRKTSLPFSIIVFFSVFIHRYFSFVAFIVGTYEEEFSLRVKSTDIGGLGTTTGINGY